MAARYIKKRKHRDLQNKRNKHGVCHLHHVNRALLCVMFIMQQAMNIETNNVIESNSQMLLFTKGKYAYRSN